MTVATPDERLAATPLFAGMAPDEVADLAGVAQPFELLPGERLFRQGDPADSLYVVESGRLETVARLPAERELSLATSGPGRWSASSLS